MARASWVGSNMPAADRLTVWAPAVASILLASIGVALAYTGAFPDVQCSGDLCLITWNVFTIPMILIGTGLGIASLIMFLQQQLGGPLPRSIK